MKQAVHTTDMFPPNMIFITVSKLGTYAGFLSICNVKCSETYQFIVNMYLVGMFTMFFFQVTCLVSVLIFRLNLLDDGSGVVCVLAIMVNNSLLIIFYVLRRDKIAQNYENMLRIVKTIVQGPVHEEFVDSVQRYSKYINKSIMLYMTSVYVLLLAEFLLKGLSYAKIIDLIPDNAYLIYALPWRTDDNATFWASLIFQTTSTFFMTIVQQANHYYLVTMMISQTLCFQYLRQSLASIINLIRDTTCNVGCNKNVNLRDNNSYIDQQIKYWAELHDQLIK